MKCHLFCVLLAGAGSSLVGAQEPVKAAAVAPAVPSNEAKAIIRADLDVMLATDQKHRQAMRITSTPDEKKALWAKQTPIDKANQVRVEEIIAQVGWPSQAEFGPNASRAVFLVLQHAPVEMMKRHYALVKRAVDAGELTRSSFALFEDRVRMYEGRPQLYGSQVQTNDKTGKRFFWTIEDETNVDKRRGEMGLPPIAQYAKLFGIDYVPPGERQKLGDGAAQSPSPDAKK